MPADFKRVRREANFDTLMSAGSPGAGNLSPLENRPTHQNLRIESVLTNIQPLDKIRFSHEDSWPDADVYEQLMLFVRLVRHIWRVILFRQ